MLSSSEKSLSLAHAHTAGKIEAIDTRDMRLSTKASAKFRKSRYFDSHLEVVPEELTKETAEVTVQEVDVHSHTSLIKHDSTEDRKLQTPRELKEHYKNCLKAGKKSRANAIQKSRTPQLTIDFTANTKYGLVPKLRIAVDKDDLEKKKRSQRNFESEISLSLAATFGDPALPATSDLSYDIDTNWGSDGGFSDEMCPGSNWMSIRFAKSLKAVHMSDVLAYRKFSLLLISPVVISANII